MFDLGRTFLAAVERCPNALAIVDGTRRLTYAEWFEYVRNVAGGLNGLGVTRGDHVVVVMQNRWEMATIHWACQFLGAVVTPLNWRAKSQQVDYCVGISDAKVVLFQDVSEQAVAGSAVARRLPRVAVAPASTGTLSFDDLLDSRPMPQLLNATAEDWSLMLFTSGTTGSPKGVPRRHRHERSAAIAHVAQNLYKRGERTLGVMPLYHTMGVRSLLSMALINGCFVSIAKFDVAAVLATIGSERITNLYLVPTLYHDILVHPDLATTDISSVRKLGFAGASMNDGLLKRLQDAFHPDLFVDHYGSSEVYTCTVNPDAPAKPGSAGRSGLNQRVRVVRLGARNGDELAKPREEGQIIVDRNGDEAFEGYWKQPEANAKSTLGEWFLTGDTGYFDEDGDLFVTGRVDDMIISGGENISPAEIESVLSLHPAIDEVAVVGLADERWGQRVVAFVKRKQPVDVDELDRYCRGSSLPDYKRPRQYVFVEALPKSLVGKILRRELAARHVDASVG